MKTEILYGIHPVAEALRAGRRKLLMLFADRARLSGRVLEIRGEAEALKIPVKTVTGAALKALSGTGTHQGIALRVGPYPFAALQDLSDPADTDRQPPFLLLLDGVQDPHNLGAMVRTALCAGISGLITTKNRCAPPTPAVSRISAGALEHVRLSQVTNLVRTLQMLKKAGIWISGLAAEGAASLYTCDLTEPTAIVIGGEEKGLRRLVRESCDRMISVPQQGPVDSLNASVAGAVVMYEAWRQRNAGF